LKGFFIGRSACRHCHHTLHVRDLIPLRSFFSQGGKCRYCHSKLSRRYPLLEI
jgi:leader peptidase (prepilin peptidase)/N-methyltransferase